MHICYSVSDKCYNMYDSYGEICVWCNCCGKIDKTTMLECRLELMKRKQENNENFSNWAYDYPDLMETQKKNVEINKKYYAKKIREIERQIKKRDSQLQDIGRE